jgi:hypothetical protein
VAAVVTAVSVANDVKRCSITVGGRARSEWLHMLRELEAYARAEGCASMRIVGRKGWMRELPDYALRAVILEKELS